MRVAVVGFLIRLTFPQLKLLPQIIRSQYGDTTRKRLRKLEKVDYCLQKAELDLDVLFRCRENVPRRFLNFW